MINFYYGCEDIRIVNDEWLVVINEDFIFDFNSTSLEVKNLISFTDWEPKTFEEAESDKFVSRQKDLELITFSIKKSLDTFIGQQVDLTLTTSFPFLLMKEIQLNLKQLNTENHWVVYFKQKRG